MKRINETFEKKIILIIRVIYSIIMMNFKKLLILYRKFLRFIQHYPIYIYTNFRILEYIGKYGNSYLYI